MSKHGIPGCSHEDLRDCHEVGRGGSPLPPDGVTNTSSLLPLSFIKEPAHRCIYMAGCQQPAVNNTLSSSNLLAQKMSSSTKCRALPYPSQVYRIEAVKRPDQRRGPPDNNIMNPCHSDEKLWCPPCDSINDSFRVEHSDTVLIRNVKEWIY